MPMSCKAYAPHPEWVAAARPATRCPVGAGMRIDTEVRLAGCWPPSPADGLAGSERVIISQSSSIL